MVANCNRRVNRDGVMPCYYMLYATSFYLFIILFSGTSHLDLFTHSLLVKCTSPEYLDRLLETLINVIQSQHSPGRSREGVIVAKRFLRSVIRVFVVISAQSAPEKLGTTQSYSYSTYSQPLSKCRRAFMVSYLICFVLNFQAG